MKRAGYDVISRGVERGYDELIAQSEKAKNESKALAACIYDYVTNIEEVRADMVLSAAAIKDEELRALLERNNERYEASLKQYMSDNQAKMISVSPMVSCLKRGYLLISLVKNLSCKP